MKQPYIGITDFATVEQTRKMLDIFAASRVPDSRRVLMVGVMTSYKILNNLPTKWAAAWLSKYAFGDVFVRHPLALNTLHYADYDGIDVQYSLTQATACGYPRIDALQLDMIWPPPSAVVGYHWQHPEIKIILQVGGKALERVSGPREVVAKLRDYDGAIDYVLFDKSMGRGLGMDAEGLRPYLRAVRESGLDIGLAGAGGLGPSTLHLVEPLVAEFPDLSIDAQGKLRPSGNAMDPIDWGMAEEYLKKAPKILK